MENIPPLYWMIVIGLLASAFFMLIFYLALSARELSITLKTANKALATIEEMTTTTKELIDKVEKEVTLFTQTFHIFNMIIKRLLDYAENLLSRILSKNK